MIGRVHARCGRADVRGKQRLRGLGTLWLLCAVACAEPKPPVDREVTPVAAAAAPVPASVGDEFDEDATAPFSIETADGATFRLKYRNAQIATFHYVFWGESFNWADPVIKNTKTAAGITTFELEVAVLGLKIAGKIAKTAPAERSFEYV